MLIPSAICSCHRREPAAEPAPVKAVENLAGLRRYFLEVEIQVPATQRKEFAETGHQFLENFNQVQLKLAVSAWRTDVGPIFAVNYWDMGRDANVLLEAELALPDVTGFNAFNALVQSEVKNIVVPIAGNQFIPVDPRKRTAPGRKLPAAKWRYLRVVSEVPAQRLPEFVARVEGHMEYFTKRRAGWFLGDSFLGITGRDGTVSQIWIVPAKDIVQIPNKLKEAPWLREDVLRGPPIFQIMTATQSDPLLQDSGNP